MSEDGKMKGRIWNKTANNGESMVEKKKKVVFWELPEGKTQTNCMSLKF